MDTRTDIELITEYLAGNSRAFDTIVLRHTRSIFAFVYRLSSGHADTADIVQDTFVKAWKHAKRFKVSETSNDRAFQTWLFAIARNTTIDWFRKKKATPFSAIDEWSDTHAENGDERGITDTIADTEPLAHELFEKEENVQIIEKALETLSLHERSIILLHNYEELTFEDVAEILDIPMNTVKSKYRRALEKLKQIIERMHQNRP
ncbi:MAG: hypothetical protein RIT04_687 [Candidatus Parcubacteria bacterium]